MAQLNYNTTLTNAFPGMLADTGPRNDKASASWENATAQPYGTAVGLGTDPDTQADVLADAAGAVLGVLVHSHANEVGSDDENLVDTGKMASVLKVGRIYVTCEDACTPASSVFVRTAAGGGGTQLGAFRTDSDTSTARQASGMRWVTSAGAGDLAILEIDADAALS